MALALRRQRYEATVSKAILGVCLGKQLWTWFVEPTSGTILKRHGLRFVATRFGDIFSTRASPKGVSPKGGFSDMFR